MARRVDDLLSIFDPNRSTSGDGQGSARKKSTKKKAAGKKRGFQGLMLSPKQVWMGGSAALLLLLLTFVLGLAIGRPGGGNDEQPVSLRRQTSTRVMVRADFALRSPHTEKPITRRAVFEKLTKEFNVPQRAIVDIRVEDDRMVIELGPFRSEQDAERYVQKEWQLPAVHLNLAAPFRFFEIVPYQPRAR